MEFGAEHFFSNTYTINVWAFFIAILRSYAFFVLIQVNLLLPILFLIACIFLVVAGTMSAPKETGIGIAVVCSGVPVYFLLVRPKTLPKWVYKIDSKY